MKAPSKPTKPSEPKRPEQTVFHSTSRDVRIYSSESLNEVLKQARDYGVATPRTTFDMDAATFEYDSDGGLMLSVPCKISETLSDEEFARKLGKWKAKYTQYLTDVENYAVRMAQYEKDLVLYKKWQANERECEEKALLARLLKKHPQK